MGQHTHEDNAQQAIEDLHHQEVDLQAKIVDLLDEEEPDEEVIATLEKKKAVIHGQLDLLYSAKNTEKH